ncbi:MAG: sugar-binding transcriptional regulator [Chloroflexi bacterium]|nr:sugar-binding transcriptional regulator [Chloroflexota bacterium]
MEEDLGTRLLVKVAQLYHLQGLNQDQIARQVGVSRSKVSRMVKEARERGLVEISIHYPTRFSLDLERRLESELGLREAVVVNAGGVVGAQGRGSVAGAAADYLVRVLQPGDVLGVSGGETVALAAQLMPTTAVGNVSVVQLGTAVAYLGDRAAYSSAEVARQIAQKLGSMDRLMLIPIPSLLDNESIRDALLRDTSVRQAMARLGSCSVALVGIGAVSAAARRVPDEADGPAARPSEPRQVLPVTDAEVAELQSAGAVGEICSRFFDAAGAQCVTSLDRRMVALDLNQLRAVPLVVGVARGQRKAAAILAAVRGGYVKSLVTDDATAAAVLALDRARIEPSVGPTRQPSALGKLT